MDAIKPNFVVWDIGANVGFYSKLIASKLDLTGLVIAIEPLRTNFTVLENAVSKIDSIKCFNFGISHQNELVKMRIGKDSTHATSAVVYAKEFDTLGCEDQIALYTVDHLIVNEILPVPNAIKIDVEGFELNVLLGMKEALASRYLSMIGIEIHFELLENYGFKTGPKDIENLLIKNEFNVTWTDSSHLIALK